MVQFRMPKRFKHLRRYFEYRYFRYFARTLLLAPPLVGILALLLLWLPAQMGEVYLTIIEASDYMRGLFGLAFLMLFGALLFCWHLSLATPRIDGVYTEFPDIRFDRRLIRIRDAKALGCATLPFIGLLLGLIKLGFETENLCANYGQVSKLLDAPALAGCIQFHGLPFLTNKVAAASLLAAAAGVLNWVYLLPRLKERARGRKWVICICASLTLLAAVGPMIEPDHLVTKDLVVSVAWWLGPLVVILIVLLSATTVLAALSWLSERTHLPFTRLLFFVAIAMAAVGISKNVTSQATQGPGDRRGSQQVVSRNSDPLHEQFREWLKRRSDRESFGKRPYPVFIVAAQGGGIYAASATAAFLSAIQDACPSFAEHVFAISGVSGGAVGATIFHALLPRDSPPNSECPDSDSKLRTNVERIVLTDHLSPVVALVLPDLLRKLLPESWRAEDWDRAGALEHSLICAFEGHSSASWLPRCDTRAFKGELTEPFDSHWNDGRQPALVLNTTWVETGFRAAFAPSGMQLHGVGDGTLYAFSDFPERPPITLVQAAVASARFPLIAPAWSLQEDAGHLWNFVDGGYADNSGATTAFEIYKSLRASEPNIDLRLIILTDAAADPDLSHINGLGFSDTLAPITALLNVRSQLASRAVTQAIASLDPAHPDAILLIKLEQRAFPLPLGWKISHTQNDVIRFMLGSSGICKQKAGETYQMAQHSDDPIQSWLATIVDNSCVQQKVETLLSGQQQPSG
jgi:hypothetical protein